MMPAPPMPPEALGTTTDGPKRLLSGPLVLVVVFLAAFVVLFKPWVHGYDPTGYYSWLRSVVIDGDLDTTNEFEHFGQASVGGGLAPTGYRNNPYAIGSAILWAPPFLIAHGLTLVARQMGAGWPADGYAMPYIWAVSLASAVYGWAAVCLTYRMACRQYDASIALLASLSIWLASPLVFYQYSHPAMAHANDAFACALFLYTWQRTRATQGTGRYALLGLTAGLGALVRTQNAILVLFPLLEIGATLLRPAAPARTTPFGPRLAAAALSAAVFAAVWWLTFLPQLLVWRVVFGAWWPGNPYSYTAGNWFDLAHPRILEVLFSTNHGLFLWTPIVLVGVVGWFWLWRRDRALTAVVAGNFALQVYVIAAWSMWNGAAAFGQRFFVNLTPAFGLGLAALLSRLAGHVRWRWLAAGCAGFIVWNGLLLMRYVLNDIPREGPVPLEQLFLGQFTVVFRYADRVLQALIERQ